MASGDERDSKSLPSAEEANENGNNAPQMKNLETTLYGTKVINRSSVSDDEENDNRETFCCGLCCFTGCVWVVIGSIYFFFVLPACIILIFHGTRGKNYLTLGLGIACVVFFFIFLPGMGLCIRRCRRRCIEYNQTYNLNNKVINKADVYLEKENNLT